MRRIAVVVCLVTVLFSACGRNDNPAVDDTLAPPAKIDLVAKDFSYDAPPSTVDVERLVTLTVKNEGTEDHEAALLKLADGKTLADVDAFFKAQTPSGPPPFTVAGGTTGTAPGTSASVTQTLPAGNYAFVCFIPSPDGTPHVAKGMVSGLTVTGNSTTSLPLPEGVNAEGEDYAFKLPELSAGTKTIRFRNTGKEDHVLGIAKLAEGKTAEDALKWLTDHQGPPPLQFLGGPVVGVGGSNSVTFKFEKGDYVVYCPVPVAGDAAQTPHYARGMFQGVTIT